MKRIVFAIALLCVLSATASAWPYPPVEVSLNRVQNTPVHGVTNAFDVWYNNTWRGVGGGGFFTIDVTHPVPEQSYRHSLICIDIGTYISSHTWDATRHYVPPVPSEPPYSIADAIEIFYRYEHVGIDGRDGWRTDTRTAGAVQLALWEITHEVNWRSGFDTDWWATGDNKIQGYLGGSLHSNVINARNDAYGMLHELRYGTTPIDQRQRAFYYQPDVLTPSQGLLGQAPPIPEPSTLILLGLGLTAAGVGVIRRRKA